MARLSYVIPSPPAIAAVRRATCSHAATSSNSRPRSPTRPRHQTKRKVALLLAYDGAHYHGLQRNRHVNTISDVLEAALHSSHAIADCNLGALNKLQWQLAARTDRGVSAAGNVISAKLLFSRDELQQGNALRLTASRVQHYLPSHVHLLDIARVTQSFSARASCSHRWYEYLLPQSALHGASIHSFDRALRHYEGTHYFHNFTVGQHHCLPPTNHARRFVMHCSCDLQPVQLPNNSTQWIRIRVRGQSFMLHQIRKMVSLALLTCLHQVPSDAIPRALHPQTLVNIPPAPPTGLFLDCCP